MLIIAQLAKEIKRENLFLFCKDVAIVACWYKSCFLTHNRCCENNAALKESWFA